LNGSGRAIVESVGRVRFADKIEVEEVERKDRVKSKWAQLEAIVGAGQTTLEQERAVALMQEKYEICCGILHGFDWSDWVSGDAHARIGLLPAAQEQLLSRVNGKERFLQAVRDLSKAFALAVPHEKALEIRDDVAFFQAVAAALTKRAPGEARPEEELDQAVRQIIAPGGAGGYGGHLRGGGPRQARHLNPLR